MPTTNIQDSQSDRAVLSRPSLVLVTWLLDSSLDGVTKTIGSRLAAALAACAQLSSLGESLLRFNLEFNILYSGAAQRMWSLQTLRQLMTSGYGTSINIPELVSDTSSVLSLPNICLMQG